jgi:hypothetical protein
MGRERRAHLLSYSLCLSAMPTLPVRAEGSGFWVKVLVSHLLTYSTCLSLPLSYSPCLSAPTKITMTYIAGHKPCVFLSAQAACSADIVLVSLSCFFHRRTVHKCIILVWIIIFPFLTGSSETFEERIP